MRHLPTIITAPEQATADWLTWVLRTNAHLAHGRVTEVSYTHNEDAGLSLVCPLDVQYSPDTPPMERHRLLLKLAQPDRESTASGFAGFSMAEHNEKEVRFYCVLAPAMPDVPTIRCYDAVYDPATGKGHLLLEDLSQTHYLPPRRYPPPEPVCAQAIEVLARLPVHWWMDSRLGTEIGRWPEYAAPGGWADNASCAVTQFLAFLGGSISTQRRRQYARLLAFVPTY